MDAPNCNEKPRRNNHSNPKPQKDPELEAEIIYAKENGIDVPRILPSDAVKKITGSIEEINFVDKNLIKNLRNGRAERKARSRGVSGCSIKKDGNRFEYGLDCIDLAYDNNEKFSSTSSDDSNDEFDEYADYVYKYSDEEIRQIVGDYLENGNKQETLDSLEKFLITSDTIFRMVKDLIIVTLENPSSSFNLAGDLLVEIMAKKWVSQHVFIDILEEIATSVEELSKDIPKIVESFAILIAKFVDYDIITLNIISLLATKHAKDELVKECFEDAITFANNRYLLNGKCAPCGGQQSLDVLSEQFKLILKEYLLSNDKEASEKRLMELKVPHYHHEFVYQACLLALEKMHDQVMTNLADLIKDMSVKGNLAESCITKGFTRLYEDLCDLYLDLPAAYVLAQRWVDKARKAGFIGEELSNICPKSTLRSRSRTLSEGPDGKLIVEDDNNDLKEIGDVSVQGNQMLHSIENGYSDETATSVLVD